MSGATPILPYLPSESEQRQLGNVLDFDPELNFG